MNDEMLTPEEVAEFLKVPIETVWRWCREGKLPAIKIEKFWRISRKELGEYLKTRANCVH
ncbi:MAG: helix-turn-helix domain-containing protein [Planctomycetes bacterium]|nr:helix-turn-helix domain-containing protein [Planctomycetota bacterium]